MDITNGFDSVINLILQGFQFVYNTLDSITFYGISILDFMLWILALHIILPILITLLSSGQNGFELSARAVSEGHQSVSKKFDSAFYSWSTRASNRYEGA